MSYEHVKLYRLNTIFIHNLLKNKNTVRHSSDVHIDNVLTNLSLIKDYNSIHSNTKVNNTILLVLPNVNSLCCILPRRR